MPVMACDVIKTNTVIVKAKQHFEEVSFGQQTFGEQGVFLDVFSVL